jgi:MFS family permease
MTTRHITALFVCSLVPWTIANGLIPLLPLYAIDLGASQTTAGFYLAFSYAMLLLGTLSAGWFSDRIQRRREMLILSGVIAAPFVWIMGTVVDMAGLVLYSGVFFILAGTGTSLVTILAGIFSGKGERGQVFGLLVLTASIGSITGGFFTGPVVDNWGYAAMFRALGIICIIWPLTAILVRDRDISEASSMNKEIKEPGFKKTSGYYLVLLTSLSAGISLFIALLARSLIMDELNFSATGITAIGGIASLLTLPLPPVIGRYSDRIGRGPFLVGGYLCGVLGLAALGLFNSFSGFLFASIAVTIMISLNAGLGAALVTDMVPARSLGRAMSVFNSTIWVGGILGYALTGFVIDNLGLVVALSLGCALLLVATGIVFRLRRLRVI